MAPEVTPDSLRHASFRTSFRGYDPAEVEALLHAAAVKLEQIDAERRRLASEMTQPQARDLESEFEEVGREVSAILQAAREAAETMRDKAAAEAARWRSEALEEAETTRKEAAADAEALRRDAWVTSSDLLEQSATKAESMRAEAERDVLTVMGEAEREAHRLTSSARREAEDLVRNATMEAEKIIADATTRRDEIIDGANRQAATAQERARALEQRRDELMVELENVRGTLSRLEGSLEERREAMDLGATDLSSSVKVVHPPADAKAHWELGETVRVIPPGAESADEDRMDAVDEIVPFDEVTPTPLSRAAPDEPERSEPAQQVSTGSTTATADDSADSDVPDAHEPSEAVVEAPEAPEPVESEPEPNDEDDRSDDLDALFAALRGGGSAAEREAPQSDGSEGAEDTAGQQAEEEVAADDVADSSDADDGIDWLEVRDERLIPVTNRALRGVKKAMTEVQNVALDSLRTDEDWKADAGDIGMAVHAEIVGVWAESFAAGHSVAEEMTGVKVKRPPTPSTDADSKFGSALASAVNSALEQAGDGPRERQSAASRVFRVWRSDEAERRIRDIAIEAYQAGIEESRRVATGV